MSMNVVEYAKKEALRLAGVPVLCIELDGEAFIDEIVAPAAYEYYIYAPYELAQTHRPTARQSLILQIPDPSTEVTGWPSGLTAEFVGLTGFGFNNGFNTEFQRALGFLDPFANSIFTNDINTEAVDHLERLARAQNIDDAIPDEIIQYDSVTREFRLFAPSAGTFGIIFGYRLSRAEFIKPSHAIAFSKIVAKKLLEVLSSARSSVVLSGDLTLDTAMIDKRLDEINETYKDDMDAISTPVITWG